MKHRLKLALRSAYARLLFYSGLHRLVARVMPRRLTILAGHCVEDPECNAGLPADMKVSAGKLRELLGFLGRHYELCTVGEGVRGLSAGGAGRSMVALSMDDGYRDNHDTLLPLLESLSARATIFLESRPLDERRVNWSHKYFWLLGTMDADLLARQLMARSSDPDLAERLRRTIEVGDAGGPGAGGGGDLAYLVKRVLKYDAEPQARDRALDELFLERGGDERDLCDRLYMTWGDARRLRERGMELGGHTVNHHVLSTLAPERAREEIRAGREALLRELGQEGLESFAYPFGRRWDFDEASALAVRESGFRSAVTTHAGVNTARSDPFRLARWMIDEETPLYLVAAEACGGFELLRRLGVDLSE